MPKRILNYSRTEPARTILGMIVIVSMITQALALIPVTGSVVGLSAFVNVLIVWSFGGYGLWAVFKNNMKHMGTSAFIWQFIWLLSALNHAFVMSVAALIWVPFLIVALTLAVIYLYMRFEYKKALLGGVHE